MAFKRLNTTTRFGAAGMGNGTGVLDTIYTVPGAMVSILREILLTTYTVGAGANTIRFHLYILRSGGTDAGADTDVLGVDIGTGSADIIPLHTAHHSAD
jgi:hypothetical protein